MRTGDVRGEVEGVELQYAEAAAGSESGNCDRARGRLQHPLSNGPLQIREKSAAVLHSNFYYLSNMRLFRPPSRHDHSGAPWEVLR